FGTALPWPWTTFAINVAGSFLIGLVAGLAVTGALGIGPSARVVLAVGVLGGFTTFSSFSRELLEALAAGRAARTLNRYTATRGASTTRLRPAFLAR
ncbi:MAG: CrcB family protein, partial [Candidatus Velthaea sp.]